MEEGAEPLILPDDQGVRYTGARFSQNAEELILSFAGGAEPLRLPLDLEKLLKKLRARTAACLPPRLRKKVFREQAQDAKDKLAGCNKEYGWVAKPLAP